MSADRRQYHRAWYAAHAVERRAYLNAYNRARRKKNPALFALYAKRYRDANKDRTRAYSILNHAIKRGTFSKQPCEICGQERSQAHHTDYTRPFAVRWLCALHHKQTHKTEQQQNDSI